ncbi:MAG: hypothetical protein ACI32C_05525 [Candidatus Enteromonas sp.]
MNENALRFLGLLNRGGKLLIGDPIEHHLKKGYALILAGSSQTVERLRAKGERAGCLILEAPSKEILGGAIGFTMISAILVKDVSASQALAKKWLSEEGAV